MSRRGWGILAKILVAILVVLSVTFSALRYSYYFVNGEELTLPVVKHFLWPEEIQEETEEDVSAKLLTINPEYDGSNDEYVYVNSDDADIVARIHQTVIYQYYDDVGSAIGTVKTWSYDDVGKTLYTDYQRQSCKMPSTDVARTEIEIAYRYDTNKIYRNYSSESYSDDGELLSTIVSDSEINRTG